MPYSSKKPYLYSKKSFAEAKDIPGRFFKQFSGKESVSIKPYLSDSYLEMEREIPHWTAKGNSVTEKEGILRCVLCCSWCWSYNECESILVAMDDSYGPWIRGGTWSVEGPMLGFVEFEEPRSINTQLYGVGLKSDLGIEIFIDVDEFALVQENNFAKFTVTYREPDIGKVAPGLCRYNMWVYCETTQCPPDVSISWDDTNSAETIARLGTVNIFVLDGEGPYDWEVSGTGFSLGAAQTDDKSNTLSADGTACGPATITVTDACVESTVGYVRCTDASGWAYKDLWGYAACGYACSRSGWYDTTSYIIVGKDAITHTCWNNGSCSISAYDCTPAGYGIFAGDVLEDCTNYATSGYNKAVNETKHYGWECS
uniref:Uncharacterized protein n=1 Tax=viral metagenome TaxID=1070528 RepID=A0A6M3LAW0_9ZZZZ